MSILSKIFMFLFTSYYLTAQETFVVNIDLGGTDSELPWNTLTNSNTGKLTELLAMNGQVTDIGVEVYDAFNGTNTNGTLQADESLELPSFASGDSFFGNSVEWSGILQPTAAIKLTGLDDTKEYRLSLFASRLASDNRETEYHVLSDNTDTLAYLKVSDNLDQIVEVENILPNAEGVITINVKAGPNNDNDFGFYYLGAMRLEYEDEVIFVEPELSLTSPTGGEYWQSGKAPEIRWNSQGVDEVLIEYSTNGLDWVEIATTSALSQSYAWTLPELSSSSCLIRISADSLTDVSGELFQIASDDNTDCHIVVLGSSTAAGTGPTSLDSAWVWMYEDTLFQNDTRFRITNLARGGFTTYNILPDGSTIPSGVNQTIDPMRNITRALSLNPNAAIINLPSNDAANSYSVEDQLKNYDLILAGLEEKEIPYWVCTPQPRNSFSSAQKMIQTDLRDSTFLRFGDFAIDFWTQLADADSNVNPSYNSGDGVHLNNAGHKILLDRVLGATINTFLLNSKETSSTSSTDDVVYGLSFYPNPTDDTITIRKVAPPFELRIYDVVGNLIQEHKEYNKASVALNEPGLQLVTVHKSQKCYKAWVLRE